MGGQYYPGKDKQRLHLRRRTLWYRIFFSSSYRRGLTALVVVYLLIVHCLNPAFNFILQYGKVLSEPGLEGIDSSDLGSSNENGGDDVEVRGVFAKPLHVAKKDAKRLMDKMKEIKNSPQSLTERKALLADIVPEWNENGEDEENGGGAAENVRQDDVDYPTTKVEDNILELRTLRNKNNHHKESKCQRGLEDLSTTLVSQTTLDRLVIMEETCKRWSGPIISVVYLTEAERDTIWDNTVQGYMNTCPHLKMIPFLAESTDQRKYNYPINRMRNVGLDDVMTSHVLVLDIDMIPSSGLFDEIHAAIEMTIEARMDDDGDRGLDPKDAIVIPAFERKVDPPCQTLIDCQNLVAQNKEFVPDTIPALLSCIDKKECIVFQSDVNREGHADTKTEEWLERKDEHLTKLPNIPCFRSQRYEPYVVIPWCGLEANTRRRIALFAPRSPYYDERFYGYGKNKIQQIAHLRERGYTFHVMQTTGFVMHYPHPESKTKETWLDVKNSNLHKEMDQLYPQYLQELHEQYEGNYVETPICQGKRGAKRRKNT